jgi:hypothetical protein
VSPVILTDAKGKPLVRPAREEFLSVVEFIRAVHAFNDMVTELANAAFVEGFKRGLS